jgi:hypothetical protein
MRERMAKTAVAMILVITACAPTKSHAQRQGLTTAEARAIAKEAYIYGFPLVESYRLQHAYFVDSTSKEYKGAWNKIHSEARVVTPADKTIQTPDVDICESVLGADLRAEALVISVPPIEKGRYYSLQFNDAYTFNFAYVGSRATGNDAGDYLLVGPNWSGDKPDGIKQVIHSETEFAFVRYRIQLLNSGDLDNVKKLQAGFRVQPFSTYSGGAAAAVPAKINFPKPLSADAQRTSIEFFSLLNFVMSYCPLNEDEAEIRARMADLGIRGDDLFDVKTWSPEIKKAVEEGMADAWNEFKDFKADEWSYQRNTSLDAYGNREHMQGRFIVRMAAAALGIHGDSAEEAVQLTYLRDTDDDELDGTRYHYTMRLEPANLPPVTGFWSLTIYELPSKSLAANPLNRYRINSSMIPSLKRDPEGNIPLYLMHDSPGKERESNWLPAPKGGFMVIMRLYWPKETVLDDEEWDIPEVRFRWSLEDELKMSDEELQADSEENFARQIKPIVAEIQAATSVTIYEGLPHQRHKRMLFDELATKKTVTLHSFPFYDVAITPTEADAAKLIAICGQQKTFGIYRGAKLCGGFHPDWCVEFKKDSDVYQMLVCFGCREVRLYGPRNQVFSDLDKGTMKSLRELLTPLQKNCPKAANGTGFF